MIEVSFFHGQSSQNPESRILKKLETEVEKSVDTVGTVKNYPVKKEKSFFYIQFVVKKQFSRPDISLPLSDNSCGRPNITIHFLS